MICTSCVLLYNIHYTTESFPNRRRWSGKGGHCHANHVDRRPVTFAAGGHPIHRCYGRHLCGQAARLGELAPLGLTLGAGHKGVGHHLVAGHHAAVVTPALGEVGPHLAPLLYNCTVYCTVQCTVLQLFSKLTFCHGIRSWFQLYKVTNVWYTLQVSARWWRAGIAVQASRQASPPALHLIGSCWPHVGLTLSMVVSTAFSSPNIFHLIRTLTCDMAGIRSTLNRWECGI